MRCANHPRAATPAANLAVEWHETLWLPVIRRLRSVSARCGAATKPLLKAAFMPHHARRKNLLKPMKIKLTAPRRRAGFTLTELLVVIAIIAILAAMIMTVFASAQKHALVMKARTEIADIVNAINAYDTDYGRFPITDATAPVATQEKTVAGVSDFTTGLVFGNGAGPHGYAYDNNSNVVAVLMDLEIYPSGKKTVNFGHVKNPKQTKFLNARLSGYDPATDPNQIGGVDKTGVYRDPWGNPYIITMNTSYSMENSQAQGQQGTSDLLYSLQSVSQNNGSAGINGLVNSTDINGGGNNFLFHGKVMVWSAGPDKSYDTGPANSGKNKDNVLSWQ
jgi:prepilin-type N-terminal cleavage/methylation domain-containing protein